MIRSLSTRLVVLGSLVALACSSSDANPPESGAGGRAGAGGGSAGVTGGTTGTGGGTGTGGATGTGGSTGTSGSAPGAGGSAVGTGGAGGAGGPTGGSGGASSSRDAAASGGSANGGSTGARDSGAGGTPTTRTDSGSPDPGTTGDGDIMVGPTYTSSPDLRLKANAPPGFTVSFTMTSAMSAIYKGDDFTPPQPFSRQIRVFVPQQYVDGAASPFMVSSDGFYAGLQTVVQNLADDPNPDHHVPPLTIIGIQNGPDTQGRSERSLEYDTVSDRYWQFVTKEVIPAVLANADLKAKFPGFKLTSDPDGRGGYGCSSGGPAVMGLAWFGDFNRVLSFSGSYTALRPNAEHPFGAWEYTKMFTDAPLRPSLRIFLEVGQNDNGSTTADAQHRNWVTSNQNLAAALKAKGNHYRFVYAQGAGHCDNNARNQVMPEGMIWLWRGYQAK